MFANSQNIYSFVKDFISEDDFQDGISLLEKMINIDDEKDGFDEAYGVLLNSISTLDPKIDVKSICQIEEFFSKLFRLAGKQTDGMMMMNYYTEIGFYDMLKNRAIIKARLNDPQNKDGGAFRLNSAESKYYEGCPNHFYHYIVAYQFRNTSSHVSDKESSLTRMKKISSLLVVYLDQCLKNKELIESTYDEHILQTNIDYSKFVEQAYIELADFENFFLQLEWVDEKEKRLDYGNECCFKFIGEAGAGKTTQMKKKYWDEVKAVYENKKEILPIWINLGELNGIEEATLEQKVKSLLDKYSDYYDTILRNNRISLYLDGYNEVLLSRDDKHDAIKKKLATDIDALHRKYPQMSIFMTDRKHRSNPPCLQRHVKVCHYNGMNMEDIRNYCNKKLNSEDFQKMNDYLLSDNASWLENNINIPGKIDKLITLVLEDVIPQTENDFYKEYLEFILDREWNEKKETRLDELRFLLHRLARNLNGASDEKSEYEILELWSNNSEAARLLTLAKELPILVPGSSEREYKFAYTQYYHIFSK